MAKLYFRYGAMSSSKTANALMTRYNYLERGREVVLLKPKIDTRDGAKTIKSRIGISAECEYVEVFLKPIQAAASSGLYLTINSLSAIIVDEAQFLSKEQVEALAGIVDNYDIPVICYGLRTDFQGKFFEGSARLMEMADVIEELPTVCWCGKKAHYNARICNGKIVRKGNQIEIGGNDTYISLCRKHFHNGQLSNNEGLL